MKGIQIKQYDHQFFYEQMNGSIGDKFVKQLSERFALSAEKQIYKMVFREAQEKNHDYPEFNGKIHISHDAIIYAISDKLHPEQQRSKSIFSASIEFKDKLDDLWKDKKILQYLGVTDTMFIAVPKNMLRAAFLKLMEFGDAGKYIGVMEIDSGLIIRFPIVQNPGGERYSRLIESLAKRAEKEKRSAVPIRDMLLPELKYSPYNGLMTLQTYIPDLIKLNDLGLSHDLLRRYDGQMFCRLSYTSDKWGSAASDARISRSTMLKYLKKKKETQQFLAGCGNTKRNYSTT